MSKQVQITTFFKCKGSMQSPEKVIKKNKRHSLSLKNAFKQKNVSTILETKDIGLLLTDEESDNSRSNTSICSVTPSKFCQSQSTNIEDESDTSNTTEVYSLSPYDSIFSHSSPKKNPNQIPSNFSSPSTSKSNKFFSPTKKRSVTKVQRNVLKVFSYNHIEKVDNSYYDIQNELFVKVCEGFDDKTKFFLKMISEFLLEESMQTLLDSEARTLLNNCMLLYKPGQQVVCRLYWRREGWYKKSQILTEIVQGLGKEIGDANMEKMFENLVDNGFLDKGNYQNMNTIEHYTSHLMKLDDIQDICKILKLKKQSKKNSIKALQKYCRSTNNINKYFTNSNIKDNTTHVLKLLSQRIGDCYRLTSKARETLYRVYLLSFLSIDYDYFRNKNLELMLINNKIKKETFPVDPTMVFDKPTIIFQTMEEFEHYVSARGVYENYISITDTSNKCEIVRVVYDMYKNLTIGQIYIYKSLPPWLRKFTPAYLYVKLLDLGVTELKKIKNREVYNYAINILNALIDQDLYKQHKRALWYAEKALILHKYLQDPNEAAKVLLEGFKLDLSEECKDHLRPRALKIATQKNIQLDDDIKAMLLENATKISILEGNLPSVHFYKMPMENLSKGKATYEIRTESGRTRVGVEEYALSRYLESGEFTHGYHWESKIVINLFFLLFWDIIYAKLPDVRGIFLCPFQQYPLDMFSECFYENRKSMIEARLKLIEESTTDEVLSILDKNLSSRPESEVSGVCVSSARAAGGAGGGAWRALGAGGAARVAARLAARYAYAHSGFPDLTLWNCHTHKIKFVEVKSDNDKPSMKQIQWMRYLREGGIETEFCYVGARTAAPRARRPGGAALDLYTAVS